MEAAGCASMLVFLLTSSIKGVHLCCFLFAQDLVVVGAVLNINQVYSNTHGLGFLTRNLKMIKKTGEASIKSSQRPLVKVWNLEQNQMRVNQMHQYIYVSEQRQPYLKRLFAFSVSKLNIDDKINFKCLTEFS